MQIKIENNMTQEFKTDKGEFLAVKVPQNSIGHQIEETVFEPMKTFIHYYIDGENSSMGHDIKIDNANWQIIGNAFELTEEQCAAIVEQDKYGSDGWRARYFSKSITVWHSLLNLLQIYQVNPYQSAWDELCTWGAWRF